MSAVLELPFEAIAGCFSSPCDDSTVPISAPKCRAAPEFVWFSGCLRA